MPMSEFHFPFWMVSQWHGLMPLPVEPEEASGFIAVFTTAENAAAFMAERDETEWQNKLVSRTTLPTLLEGLQRLGVQGVCLDPGRNQSGTKFTLAELADS
jgi:hypothetical protein